MSQNNCARNLSPCTAIAKAIYSASQLDKARIDYLLLFHEISPPTLHSINAYPEELYCIVLYCIVLYCIY